MFKAPLKGKSNVAFDLLDAPSSTSSNVATKRTGAAFGNLGNNVTSKKARVEGNATKVTGNAGSSSFAPSASAAASSSTASITYGATSSSSTASTTNTTTTSTFSISTANAASTTTIGSTTVNSTTTNSTTTKNTSTANNKTTTISTANAAASAFASSWKKSLSAATTTTTTPTTATTATTTTKATKATTKTKAAAAAAATQPKGKAKAKATRVDAKAKPGAQKTSSAGVEADTLIADRALEVAASRSFAALSKFEGRRPDVITAEGLAAALRKFRISADLCKPEDAQELLTYGLKQAGDGFRELNDEAFKSLFAKLGLQVTKDGSRVW
mmetsp:Transcript_22792/g.50185  ORF Transcript_22792/g.50185 Transcript_22792/m.50185 type:complete len:329 (-) Transcript_22792:455-1441(-)|eukprot:CAMPEP_0206454018 /NCGR_PEP_ID=MMETSP0324_2-20121206/20889_1 /ASSEMBLY_ACC=CAM_ASM_000836 /TAXON_ID=2866 /ORGANISM="Crypthecodinium cohnii, Strain Seligo" /LENGTH=328 /DNA_ID=CAMNT_0053924415 /DNA_START=320 /DNA_END=1303 /DNA_ORIENTATION=+